MTRGVHRVTPSSMAGRRMAQAKGALLADQQRSKLTKEQEDWNRKVAAERLQKKTRAA